MDYLSIKILFCGIKGQYVDIIILLYHDVKVSYSDITIQYPGLQMQIMTSNCYISYFNVIFRQVYYTILDIIITCFHYNDTSSHYNAICGHQCVISSMYKVIS